MPETARDPARLLHGCPRPHPDLAARAASAPARGRPRSGRHDGQSRRACRSRSATTRRSGRSRRSCWSRTRSGSRPHASTSTGRRSRRGARRSRATPRDPAYDWASLDADVARSGHAGLAVQLAFWHVPAWANGGAAANAWPLDAADLGDFAYAVARRYPQVRLFYDWNEPNVRMFAEPNTVEAYEPMARAVYAGVHEANPEAQVVAGNLARYRDAGRDPAAWAARLHADGGADGLLRRAPVPAAAGTARRARPREPHRPAGRAGAGPPRGCPGRRLGVRLVVGRRRHPTTRRTGPRRRSSSRAARPGSPASSSGASTTTRCRSASRPIHGSASAGWTPPVSPSRSTWPRSTRCGHRSTAPPSAREAGAPAGWPLLSTIPLPAG